MAQDDAGDEGMQFCNLAWNRAHLAKPVTRPGVVADARGYPEFLVVTTGISVFATLLTL